jgi:hypothetical protein
MTGVLWMSLRSVARLRYIKEHFEVIPLSEAVELLRNRRIRRPTAVITFYLIPMVLRHQAVKNTAKVKTASTQ